MGSTSFFGFSCPNNLLLVFLNLFLFRNLLHIFSQVLGTFSGSFFLFFLYLILCWLVTTESRFFALKRVVRKRRYWIEVKMVFNVKTTTIDYTRYIEEKSERI